MDTLILIVLALGALLGYAQGAFKQIANFAGVIIGLYVAVGCYDKFGHQLASITGSEDSVGNIVAFVLLVIIVPLALGYAATLLTRLFKAVHLGCINRLAGAIIGIVSYALLLSFAFNLYDFATSNGGIHPEKLEERSSLFYSTKQSAQVIIPDLLIVTDATEEAAGATPHHGMADLFHLGNDD